MSQVFLASRNAKKLEELRRILAERVPDIEVLGLDDVTPYDEPAETEPTFEGNALLKARAGVEATGLPALADDSGLCVDALNGMPGVLSARWAGARPRTTRRNNGSCSPSSPTCPTIVAARSSVCGGVLLPAGRRRVESWARRDAGRGDPGAARERRLRLRRRVRARRRDPDERRDAARREGR